MRLIGAGGTVVAGVVAGVVVGVGAGVVGGVVAGVVVGVADELGTGAVVGTTVGDGGEVTTEFDAEPCGALVVTVGALTVVVGTLEVVVGVVVGALEVVVGVVVGAVDTLDGTLSSVDTTEGTDVKSVSELDEGSSDPHPIAVANITMIPTILRDRLPRNSSPRFSLFILKMLMKNVLINCTNVTS